MRFRCISGGAVACDGGSLALILDRIDGARTSLTLNRAIRSRGMPSFGKVTLDGAAVSGSTALELSAELERLQALLPPDRRSEYAVSPFIAALRTQSAES